MIRMLDAIEHTVRPGSSGAPEPNATLLPEAQNAAAQSLARLPQQTGSGSSLTRLPRQTDAASSLTNAMNSQLVTALATTDEAPVSTTGSAPVQGGRRAPWLVLGAAAVLAL